MRISALDHIVLNVADVERSLDFYQRCLGLAGDRVEEWRRGEISFPSLRINDATIIDLVQRQPDAEDSPAKFRLNLAHFCLVTEETELTDVVEELSRAGVEIEQGPVIRSGARGDGLSIYFHDPDQNLIEMRTYSGVP